MRILCIGAHPDDVEIAMGGTVLSLVDRGHAVQLLDLTNGEPTPFGTAETRLKEAGNAAKILNVNRILLNMPNRWLEDTIENRKTVAAQIREFRPDYIFAPYTEDAHPDHIAAGEISEAARFYSKLTKTDIPGEPIFPKRVIFYFPIHLRLRIEPSFLIDIENYIEKKREAILCYKSQFENAGKNDYVDKIINENQYWGFQAGCSHAEPFYQKENVSFRSWPDSYF